MQNTIQYAIDNSETPSPVMEKFNISAKHSCITKIKKCGQQPTHPGYILSGTQGGRGWGHPPERKIKRKFYSKIKTTKNELVPTLK